MSLHISSSPLPSSSSVTGTPVGLGAATNDRFSPIRSHSPLTRGAKAGTPLSNYSSAGTPLKSMHHHHHVLGSASSTSLRHSLPTSHHEVFSRHDLLIKQMDRQRAEMFQRVRERVQRARSATQQCADQLQIVASQLAHMEEKMSDTREFQFKNVFLSTLQADLEADNMLADISSPLNFDRGHFRSTTTPPDILTHNNINRSMNNRSEISSNESEDEEDYLRSDKTHNSYAHDLEYHTTRELNTSITSNSPHSELTGPIISNASSNIPSMFADSDEENE